MDDTNIEAWIDGDFGEGSQTYARRRGDWFHCEGQGVNATALLDQVTDPATIEKLDAFGGADTDEDTY